MINNYVPNGNDDLVPSIKNVGKEKEKFSEVYEENEDAGAIAIISR